MCYDSIRHKKLNSISHIIFQTNRIHNKVNLTLVKSLTGSYPVDLAHSFVEIRLMSPSSFDALTLASASIGSPTKETPLLFSTVINTEVSSHLPLVVKGHFWTPETFLVQRERKITCALAFLLYLRF